MKPVGMRVPDVPTVAIPIHRASVVAAIAVNERFDTGRMNAQIEINRRIGG